MRKRLEEILSIQSTTYRQWRMFAYLIRKLKPMPDVKFYVDNGNIYATKGVAYSYPAVVAHMDTVHEIVKDFRLLTNGWRIAAFDFHNMEQVGVGGDDKVGIFIAMECLLKFDNIKVAFFRDEETGCNGSYEADMSFFDDVNFVLQCDRRGSTDVVHDASGVPLSSKQFRKAIRKTMISHGYSFSSGSITDVMALKEKGLSVSAANISCGYYSPHTSQEYVDVYDVFHTFDFVSEIIEKFGKTRFEHRYTKSKFSKYEKWVKHNNGKFSGWKSRTFDDNEDFIEPDAYGYEDHKRLGLPKHSLHPDQCESCLNISHSIEYRREFDMYICEGCQTAYEASLEEQALAMEIQHEQSVVDLTF